ncbi:MAG: hypothetical protein AAF533_21860 [Acidobacteriota bacterium]
MTETIRRDFHLDADGLSLLFHAVGFDGRRHSEIFSAPDPVATDGVVVGLRGEEHAVGSVVRVVLGDLSADERASWVSRSRSWLRVPNGLLQVEAANAEDGFDRVGESSRILRIPPGGHLVDFYTCTFSPPGLFALRETQDAAAEREWLRRWKEAIGPSVRSADHREVFVDHILHLRPGAPSESEQLDTSFVDVRTGSRRPREPVLLVAEPAPVEIWEEEARLGALAELELADSYDLADLGWLRRRPAEKTDGLAALARLRRSREGERTRRRSRRGTRTAGFEWAPSPREG